MNDKVLEYKWEGEFTYATLENAYRVVGSLEKVGDKTYRARLATSKSVPVETDDQLIPGVDLVMYGYADAGTLEEEFEADSVEHAFVLFSNLTSDNLLEHEKSN